MPTDKEIEAALLAFRKTAKLGSYERSVKKCLEAAEKVRVEATIRHVKEFEDSGGIIGKGEDKPTNLDCIADGNAKISFPTTTPKKEQDHDNEKL